jgi:hypothetical protein
VVQMPQSVTTNGRPDENTTLEMSAANYKSALNSGAF